MCCFVADEEGDTIIILLLNTEVPLQLAGISVTLCVSVDSQSEDQRTKYSKESQRAMATTQRGISGCRRPELNVGGTRVRMAQVVMCNSGERTTRLLLRDRTAIFPDCDFEEEED